MSTTMSPTEAGVAFVEVVQLFVAAYPDGWQRVEPGAYTFVTGTDVATLNGVLVTEDAADPDAVLARLDEVAQSARGYSVQGRAAAVEAVVRRTGTRLVPDAPRPLMVLERGAAALPFNGIAVREVGEDEQDLFIRTGAASFGAPPEVFAQMFRPEVFAVPGTRTYLGEVDGEVVATAHGITLGDVVGVFAIGTVPSHRGRGYGAALTAAAVEGGFRDGARSALLQASELGFPVYERMGFETVDVWPVWVSAPVQSGA